MVRKMLIAATVAGSLTVSGCAGNNGNDDMTGALLLGAVAVVGLGLLAASGSSDDDDGYDSGRRGRHGHHRSDYGAGDYRYANNGRCDDARYRTSNGGHASAGTDERDCRRFGDGLK